MIQEAVDLPSKCEALSSNPSTEKEREREKKERLWNIKEGLSREMTRQV
jgi:hypothetical protein